MHKSQLKIVKEQKQPFPYLDYLNIGCVCNKGMINGLYILHNPRPCGPQHTLL